jgi:hypothetical protein
MIDPERIAIPMIKSRAACHTGRPYACNSSVCTLYGTYRSESNKSYNSHKHWRRAFTCRMSIRFSSISDQLSCRVGQDACGWEANGSTELHVCSHRRTDPDGHVQFGSRRTYVWHGTAYSPFRIMSRTTGHGLLWSVGFRYIFCLPGVTWLHSPNAFCGVRQGNYRGTLVVTVPHSNSAGRERGCGDWKTDKKILN